MQAPAQYEPRPRVLHRFLDGFPISRVIAVRGAMLAGRLGIHRTAGSPDQCMSQQLAAIGAQKHRLGGHLIRLVPFELGRRLFRLAMAVPTVKLDEPSQRLQVTAKLPGSGRLAVVGPARYTWKGCWAVLADHRCSRSPGELVASDRHPNRLLSSLAVRLSIGYLDSLL